MIVEIVKPNRNFKAIKIFSYVVVLSVLVDFIVPNVNYPGIVYKILFVVILAVATLNFFIKSFDVVGEFECLHDSFRLVMYGIKNEFVIQSIDIMTVVILAYTGKSIPVTIRTHHGADNKLYILIGGEQYSFFF